MLLSVERDRDGPDQAGELEVLEENVDTVQVFCQCQPQWAVGMGGAAYLGIAATEVRAALHLSRIPRARWPEIAAGVQIMSRTTAEIRNKKQ